MSGRREIVQGVSWSAFERLAVQGLQFAAFVFMARILTPTDYGLVSMLGFFIIICQLVAEGGLSQAIIRKVDRTEADCSTSFYVNVFIGLALYALLYFLAPAISSFYSEPALTDLLRVLALCVVIQSTLVVHRAILTARLDFKTQAKSTLVGALMSGIVGLYMAYAGYGVWSLAGLQLTNQVATAVTLWIVTDWRPRAVFSGRSFRKLFGFGSKLLVSNVLNTVYQSLYTMIIGKVFSAYALGCYSNARQIGSISSENLTNIVQRAAFPMFCCYQSDPSRLRSVIHDYLRLTTFFIAPIMLGLAALAEPLTIGLIGFQWLYTARLLRILCISFLIFPLNAINFMILEIKGKGGVYLRLQTFNIIFGIICLCCALPYGLSAVCCGLALSSFVSFAVNSRFAGGMIGIGFLSQVKAIIPTLFNAFLTGTIVYAAQYVIDGDWAKVCLGIPIGLLVYVGLSVAFQTELCKLFVGIFRRRRQ